jgi:hypothetical protein
VQDACGVATRPASPHGIAKLDRPAHAAIVGLVHLAHAAERRDPGRSAGWATRARLKAAAFINEYF